MANSEDPDQTAPSGARWPHWLSWMRVRLETPAEVGNILSWRMIMKYFLWSFVSFWQKNAQYWLIA